MVGLSTLPKLVQTRRVICHISLTFYHSVLALSKAKITEPNTSKVPNFNGTTRRYVSSVVLYSFKHPNCQIATCEQYKCAINQYFDFCEISTMAGDMKLPSNASRAYHSVFPQKV